MGGQDEMGASRDKPGSGTHWAKPETEEPRQERVLGVPWSRGVMEKVCRHPLSFPPFAPALCPPQLWAFLESSLTGSSTWCPALPSSFPFLCDQPLKFAALAGRETPEIWETTLVPHLSSAYSPPPHPTLASQLCGEGRSSSFIKQELCS